MIRFIKNILPIELKMRVKLAKNDFFNRIQLGVDRVTLVNQPLILISQIQRSGGTLLNSLFDGHSECHVYPGELMWGSPEKWNFPNKELINLSNNKIFTVLIKNKFSRYRMFALHGYHKGKLASEKDSIRFTYNFCLHNKLFKLILAKSKSISVRLVLNTYLTSFFNSWINYQNLYGKKKYVVAFTPRTIMFEKSVNDFFLAYPDGYILSIVREPGGWWSSAKKHGSGYFEMDLENALDLWKQSVQKACLSKEKKPERVFIISFEKLLLEPEAVMKRLYLKIGLTDQHKTINIPTFNNNFVHSDSSYTSTKETVDLSPVDRYKHTLSSGELERIKEYQDFYEKVSSTFI